jgi:hypothetical protein
MKTYTAVIYYRPDGPLLQANKQITAKSMKEARAIARTLAAEYNGRLVTVDAYESEAL